MTHIQFRRLKKYNNQSNLIEMAHLVSWENPQTDNPLVDEFNGISNVMWEMMGTLILSDEDWDALQKLSIAPLMYFRDDVKE